MVLPVTGLLTSAMINVELGRAANAPFSLNDPAVRALAEKPTGLIKFSDLRGKANEIVVIVNNTAQYKPLLKSFFSAEDWSSNKPKKVIIRGIEYGSTTEQSALSVTDAGGGQAGSFGGKLTLVVESGGVVSGRAGAPSSAAGGSGGVAINANFLGKDGAKLQLVNAGIIRGGGGAGGAGGFGGGGFYTQAVTVREPPTGEIRDGAHGWTWVSRFNRVIIRWADQQVLWADNQDINTWFYDINGVRYYRGAPDGGISGTDFYKVYRTFQQNQNVNTDGGAGGAGGSGQGYRVPAGYGADGAGGGTNAGAGGKGGNGAGYGYDGAGGATGANGNRTGGSGGHAGGKSGHAISGIGNVDIVSNTGQLIGTQV